MDLPLISVRVVNVDWYLSEETKLPVVRIFGCTPAGQRSCLHLHGALPYFMVRPMEDEQTGVSAQFEDPDSLRALLPDLEQSIEAAMSVSAGRPSGSPTSTHEKGESWTPSGMRRKQQRVLAQLEVVRGVPFYGYNGDEALFVKVYLNNPALTGKVASVLQAGHVMSTRFQPYESHVPFLLQVFIDYNISGMSYVHLKNALFLLPLPERSSVPASKLFSQDSEGADDAARPGLFLASLVSPDLLARPPDQAARTAVFPGAESTFQGVAGDPSKSESLRLGFSPQEDTSANAVRQADEGAQDLLAGISMSQLFSQPEPSPESPRSGAGGAPRPEAKSPAAPAEDAGRDPQKRPPASWWERQSTAELEVAGTVSDIINPSLLAAGKSGAKGKGIAVASLRELWDEERERARVAGGGSQLSAPPGLELAGSQDTWTPPDGLLTQDLAGAVNDLTRNVFRRCSSVPEGLDDRPAPSSPKEGQEPEPGLSPLAHPSQPPGPVLSQGSGDVASVSESVGNYLSAPDVRATSEGDNALVDMLAALRSSQSQPDEEGSRTLSPRWRKSSSLEASVPEDPLATHTSLIGQADSITATQRRQELEEEDLSQRMAHAADAEVQYESDGSDEFKDDRDGGIAAMGAPPSPPGSSLPVVSTPATAATPARRDMPWTQRAGTIPPWSPRNARLSGALAARLASWHGESGMDADRCLKGDAVGERGLAGKGGRDEEEAAGRERGHAREASDELLPSQVSSRGLEELEDSVRTKLDAEGSPASARNGSHLPGDPPGDKGMGHSAGELVDIICSQVELERDDAGELDSGTSDMGGSRRGGADGEGSPRSDSREGSGEEFGGDGPDAGEYRAGDGGRERGPIEIQYDNSEDGEDLESIFESELAAAGDTDVEDVGEGAEDGSASDGGPLRLRGGVGLSRSRAKVPRSAAPAGGPTAVDPEPNAADGPAEDRADRGTLGSQQRNARRVRGGGVGSGRSTLGFRGFRPPRTAKGRDGNSDSDQGHLGAGTDLRRSDSVANPEYHEESRADNNGEEEEEEEEEERSQVVIPGWGSQGHHPVEYSGSQLNFVSPSRLRHSPNLARCRQVDTDGEAVSRLETPQKRKKLFGGEGRSESTEGSIPGRAAAGCSSRDDSQAMEAKPSREPSTSEGERNRPQEPNSPGRRPSESSSRCVGDSRRSTVVTSEVQSGLLPQGGYTPSGVPDTGDEIKDVKSRWQRADERLRLAQARATRPRPPRRPRRKKVGEKEKGHRDSGIGPDEKGHRTKEAPSDAEVAARSDPAAPPAADAARERPQLDGLSSPTSQHPRGKVPNTTTTTMTASMAALESVSASATSPPRGDSLEGADAHGSPEVQRQDQHSVGFHEEGEPGTPIPGVVGEDANIADVLNLEDAKDSVREAAVPSIVASPTTDGSHRDARRSLGHSAKTTPMKRREGRSSTSSHQGGVEASEEKPPDASTSLDPVLAVESSKRKRDSDVTPGNSGALGTPKHREYTLASVSSPPSPVPSRNSPLVAVDNWLRSPSLQLSAHSDQSDTVPLAQRTPAPRARRGATPAKPSTSDERRENEGRGGIGSLSESLEMPLTVGSDSAGSTSQRCGLLGSAPLSPGRHRDSRGSRALLLRPRESAPDPSESAVALERLGLPQVVHTEPYYSRKDDVPERPREFAGKVFRIPHKDDLEEFDTLPSRELLYANDERAPERTAQQQPGPAAPNSQEPAVSPRSEPSDGEFPARTRAASAGHAEGTDASSAMTGAGEATHAAGRHGVGTLPSGSKRREVGPAPLYRARPTSATEEAKGAADRGLFRGAGGSRRPKILQLVPVSSPPTYKAAVAWAKAHPPTRDGRERSAVDLLDTPALRSTRNALGVLAGGGEADLVDGTAEMSMVADANTGQLVPAPAARPASVPIAGSTRGGVSQSSSAGEGEHSPGTSRPTQAPHRASTKSQISPNTQTPSTCPSEEAGAFAFDLGKKRAAGSTAAATKAPNPKPMEVNRKHGTARGDDESPTAAEDGGLGNFGLSGGFVGRDERRGYAGDRLTVMSIEIHVQVGSDRRPDPRQDPVHGICWRVKDSFTSSDEELVETMSGAIVLPIPFRGGSARRSGGAGKGKPGVGGQAGTPTGKGAGIGAEPGEARAPPGDTCLKCGAHRSEERAGSFCTFEGGGFLGQILRGGDPGKSAERLPEAKSVDKAADGETRGQRGRFTFRHGFGRGVEVVEVCSEAQLFQALVATFCRHDPDFVVGWEIQGDSLGYIIERGFQMNPSVDMTRLLSRTPGREADRRNAGDEWGKTHGSGIWLTGRTVLNMWRLMRSELKLCSYTLQSVAEHVLRRRIPSFSYHLRSKWFSGRSVAGRSRALSEPLDRAAACLAILDKLDLIGRTSEMARLFGIDFFSVLSRGSQYRVEAVMLRVLKPQNYVAVSPSRQQVARQAAMESIPLVFEPHSRLYTSPVVVLDFQSLYPSMIIAYNLCYSTCLGKFDPRTAGTSGRLGVLTYPEAKTGEALARAADAHKAWVSSQARGSDGCESGGRARACRDGVGEGSDTSRFRSGSAGDASEASPAEGCRRKSSPEGGRQGAGPEREGPSFRGGTSQEDLFDIGKGDEGSETRGRVPLGGRRNWDPRCIHMAPNTAGFCHPSLRQGILPLMLREILETRVMIKGAMKRAEEAGQRVLARTLNARQFALKMISNVTYGYTAAGYSGRMPMAELADAIVESARQSLIAAARLVDNHETWKASVVYGDTDSLFIELPGRSLEEAHRIGREMASAVTRSCPPDVVLKFEKVYLPCILASKKRYVGFMYESPKDLKPSFDAKGIETVRRDGCPLVVKMLEKVLRILFTTKDLSQVKGYLYRQWTRILTDRASVGDFIFAKEVKLGTYASDVYMPPSAIVASKAMASDPRAEPKYCERVPYVVVAGPVGARLMDLVVSPEQLLAEGSGLRLNGKYYITKVINPALDRALALVGVDVASWYNDMPRPAPRVIPKSWKSTAEGSAPGPRRQAENDAGGGFGDEHRIYGNGSGSGGVVKKRRGGRDAEGAGARASVITNFFVSDRCSLCGDHCARSVCGRCAREPATRCVALSRLRDSDLGAQQLLEMCRQCTGHAPTELFGTESCGSLDCPVYFERHRALLRGREARELCDALGLLSA